MKVKDRKILVYLKEEFNAKYFKYSVFEKSFLYEKENGEIVSVTFASLVNSLNKDLEVYHLLDEVNSSYFPRRIKDVMEGFYAHHNLQKPAHLYITELGFELEFEKEVRYIEYFDNFNLFLEEFAKLYNVEHEDFSLVVDHEKFIGEYHKK